MSRTEKESNTSKIESIYLKVSIVEPILISCINNASFSDIYSYLHRIFPSIKENETKEHLFHLISNSFIIYDGSNNTYSTSQNGFDLLYIIYSQIKTGIVDYSTLTVKVG